MKTLKFREEIRQDTFYQRLREEVRRYLSAGGYDGFATRPLRLKALLYAVLYAGLYAVLLSGKIAFGASLGVWAALGLAGILLGLNFAHDAAHDAFFRNKRLNKVLFYLSFNALGANAYLWRLRHVDSHHLFPNVDDCDADIDDNPFIRLSPHKPLRRYHRWQHLYAPVLYLFYTLLWVFVKDFIILRKKQLANLRDIRHPAGEVALFFIAKIAYVAVWLLLPYYLGGWTAGEVAAGFVLMHFVSSYAFIFGLGVSHFAEGRVFPQPGADGYLAQSWSTHQVAASLDYHATRVWANWVFGGFNAHCAHHLFPTLSHAHYPAISRMIDKLARVYDLPYENTNWPGALAAHFRYLKTMGREGVVNS